MRITERQLRRIVRQEILRENSDTGAGGSASGSSGQSGSPLKDVDAAMKALEPFFERIKGKINPLNNKAELSEFINAIVNKIQEMNPSLEKVGVAAIKSAAIDAQQQTQESRRRRAQTLVRRSR